MLDHGVWVPLKVCFEGCEERMPPIVRVSLFESEDAGGVFRVGEGGGEVAGGGHRDCG